MKLRENTIDITGQRFNYFTVIKPVSRGNYAVRGQYWECQCDCGNIRVLRGGALRYGQRKCCGCKNRVSLEKRAITHLMSVVRCKARYKNREFTLTKDDVRNFVTKNCFYCGIAPLQKTSYKDKPGMVFLHNGIDRVDTKKGYVIDNCVPACTDCNRMKCDLSIADFKEKIKRINQCLMTAF